TERLLEGRKTPEPLLIVDLGIPAQVDGRLRPSIGECADLEVLQNASSRSLVASWADLAHVRQRVTQAVAELEAFCRERNLTQLLRSTQERHQRYIQVEIPRLLGAAFPELEQGLRAKLESELKGLVRDYTNGVFGDIKALFRSEED
ncbi:MAG: hypothetical protein RBU30_25710, partial [Polyangia bacterium]|nr:hypothetical protein [Polyangia bacterium]